MSEQRPVADGVLSENEPCRTQLIELQEQIAKLSAENQKTTRLNGVLRAILRVNHIITRERDPRPLLDKTCEALVTARGYRDAWIVLVDKAGHMTLQAEAGLGEAFTPIAEAMAPKRARSPREELYAAPPTTSLTGIKERSRSLNDPVWQHRCT